MRAKEAGQMIYPEAMLKTGGVHCGIHKIAKSVLLDIAEPLHILRVHDPHRDRVTWYISVDGVPYDLFRHIDYPMKYAFKTA